MDYKTFMKIANNAFANVINAINAFNDGNVENAKNIIFDVLANLEKSNFYDYQLYGDCKNNEIEINDGIEHNDFDLIKIDDGTSYNINGLYNLMFNDDNYFYGDLAKTHFGYGSNSIIYLLFNYVLAKQLISNNKSLMGAN